MALLASPLVAAAASEWTATVVVADPADQVNPALSGQTVVWQDYRDESSGCPTADNCLPADIFVRTMPSGAEQKLTSTPNGLDPAIDGSVVVWHDWSTGKIVMDNLATSVQQQASTATGSVQETTPAISGNRIVWVDYRNSPYYGDIYMRDITQPADQPVSVASTSTSIPDAQKDKRNPAISGNIVVWEDWRNAYQVNGWWHNPDIYMKDLSTNVESPVCTNTSDQYNPAVSGTRIVWQDYRNGKWDIYMKDLTSGTETNLTAGNPDNDSNPAISGNFVAWKDKNAAGAENIDVLNLTTGAVTQLTDGAASHRLPAASGSTFAWMDNGAGNWDIYIANDTVPPSVTSVAPSGTLTATSGTITAAFGDAGSGVDTTSVVVTLDGSPLPGCSVSAAAVSCPASGLGQGQHNISVSVKDMAGNTGTGSGSFTVDSQPPVIGPVTATVAPGTGNAVIDAGLSDAVSGVNTASVSVSVDGAVLSGCTVTSSDVNCGVTGLALGAHSIDIAAADNVGNQGSATATFTVNDTVAPQVTPDAPGSGDSIGGPTTTITASYSDPAPSSGINQASVAVQLDGKALPGCTVTASQVSCPSGDLADGSHSVRVQVSDNAANTGEADWSFTATPVAPTLSDLTPPPGATVNNATPPIAASYFDGGGIDQASVRVYVDGVDVTAQAAAGPASVSYQPPQSARLAAGKHQARVVVADMQGNVTDQSWQFAVASPQMGLVLGNVFWASLGNYQAGLLTVDYGISNSGSGACDAGQLTNSYASNAVRAYDPLPVNLGDLAPGSATDFEFLYLVPQGVRQFNALNYASCQDDGANSFLFPGPPPTS